MKPEIIDNFLDKNSFHKLQQQFLGNVNEFPWFFYNIIDNKEEKNKFQFVHIFYLGVSWNSAQNGLLEPILQKMQPVSIFRIKANLIPKTSDIVENLFHTDLKNLIPSEKQLMQWTTSIFYVNTNNGYTKFEDGTKVESVANRMVTFPANMKHTGTSCTDQKRRVVINFNWFLNETKLVN